MQAPLTINGHVLHPRVSVGGAVLRDPARAADLLHEADLAMYRAKSEGAGAVTVVLDAASPSRPVRQTEPVRAKEQHADTRS